MPFQRVGDILPGAIAQLRLTAGVERAQALMAWSQVAAEVLPGAERASRAADLQRGVLLVVVRSPAWSYELHARRPDLVATLNRRLGRRVVRDVTLRVGLVPRPSAERAAAGPIGTGRLDGPAVGPGSEEQAGPAAQVDTAAALEDASAKDTP